MYDVESRRKTTKLPYFYGRRLAWMGFVVLRKEKLYTLWARMWISKYSYWTLKTGLLTSRVLVEEQESISKMFHCCMFIGRTECFC